MKKRFIFLFLIMLIVSFATGINTKASENKNCIDFELSEGVSVKVYDPETNEEIKGPILFEDEIRIRIVASAEEGYRIVGWTYEYVKKSTNQVVHKDLGKRENNQLTTTYNMSYTYHINAVKEENFGVLLINYVNGNIGNVIGFQEVEAGEKIHFPKTNGKGHGLYKKYIKSGEEFIEFDANKANEDLTIYTEYDTRATTMGTVFKDYYKMFFKGLGKTLLFSVIVVFLALFSGTVICLLKMSDIKIINFIATGYIEIIRGVPLLLQLLIIYTVLPNINYGSFFTTEVIACLLALFINSSAYVAEIFRSGIQAVDKGQTEAARALGLSKWQTLFKIVIPQGIKNCLPSIGNELIMVIKETSLASSVNVAIGELMSVHNQIKADSYIVLPSFFVIAIMYFVVTFTLSKVVRFIERKLENHD